MEGGRKLRKLLSSLAYALQIFLGVGLAGVAARFAIRAEDKNQFRRLIIDHYSEHLARDKSSVTRREARVEIIQWASE